MDSIWTKYFVRCFTAVEKISPGDAVLLFLGFALKNFSFHVHFTTCVVEHKYKTKQKRTLLYNLRHFHHFFYEIL